MGIWPARGVAAVRAEEDEKRKRIGGLIGDGRVEIPHDFRIAGRKASDDAARNHPRDEVRISAVEWKRDRRRPGGDFRFHAGALDVADVGEILIRYPRERQADFATIGRFDLHHVQGLADVRRRHRTVRIDPPHAHLRPRRHDEAHPYRANKCPHHEPSSTTRQGTVPPTARGGARSDGPIAMRIR